MTLPTPPSSAQSEDGFDLLAFWIRNKTSIQAVAALFAAGISLYGIVQWREQQKTSEAAEAFASAKTPAELADFVSKHADMAAGGNAALLLAGKQRSEGKLEESLQTARKFLTSSPSHPLAAAAELSVASTLEQQNKTDEALETYRKLLLKDPRGFASAAAQLRIARILRSQGKLEEARSAYDSLQLQFPKSAFANEALREAQQLPAPAATSEPEKDAK